VFRSDEVVIEAICFFASQREHLLCPWGEIVHGFFTHND
jgi:hypothetical protein